jgi:coenzyme PQQ precursor peptide PqqA
MNLTCRTKEKLMAWTTPDFEEISLACEINTYAEAEL